LPQTLIASLQSKQVLLVLDNCEHLLGACAQLAKTLLQACPALWVLATSREPLRLAGERAWRVPSLTHPPLEWAPPAEELLRYEAVRLFVERAAVAEPSFRLTAANAWAIAQICARLDGIPLAIELAAARVRVMTVEQVAARLHDCFRLLTGGGRGSSAR